MTRGRGPNATVAWLSTKKDPGQLAGVAFLVDPHHALTCAHVIRDHLGLGEVAPAELPELPVVIRFDALERELTARVIEGGLVAQPPPRPGGASTG